MNTDENEKEHYQSYLRSLQEAMSNMEVTDEKGDIVEREEALIQWCKMCHRKRLSGNTMFFVGNGASATMASHMSADFSKNCGCRAVAFNDVALMTAVSNDIAFEDCFAFPLTRFARSGDMLVTVSSSGNSPNVVKAAKCARKMGLFVMTVSGMKPTNRSRGMGDLNFWVPADTYGLVEASHQVLLHCWLDTYLKMYPVSNE